MRALRIPIFILGAAMAAAVPAAAADQTWTGVISDSMCGPKHHAMSDHDKKMSDGECTRTCVEDGGAKYVFVHEGKSVPIANQDFTGLSANAGVPVKLTGTMSGENLTVSKIVKASPAKKKAAAKKA